MLSKQQFGSLIKENQLWPGYNWYLENTSHGLVSASNKYIDGVVEIIIDYLYQRYVYIQQFVGIFDINRADSEKEVVGIQAPDSLVRSDDFIRVYNTLNYDGIYRVIDYTSNIIYIGNSYFPETLSNISYYTIISPDRYTESEAYPFEPETPVIQSVSIGDPVFLPHLSYTIGRRYNSALSIAKNREFIKSAIDIYKIKGSILSIKRIMALMGYSCDVVEPYALMLQYGKSTYDFTNHYQDWKYYHDGVFEVVTDSISLNDYKDSISTLVQPVGTKMLARANLKLGLVPFLGESLTEYSDSYFIELLVKIFKAGSIYDTITHDRTRSGNVELFGIYDDVSADLGDIPGYRRVWDSKLFSLSDLSTPTIVVNPAGRFSITQGAFSGDTSIITGWTSPYDEMSRFDLQLDLVLTSKNERPAMRSEFARRSGEFSMSGLDGDSWTWKPYFLLNYDTPTKVAIANPQNYPLDIWPYEEMGYIDYSTYSGDILSVNRWMSGITSIHGIEMSIGFREVTLTPEEWAERIYWSWDDASNIVDLGTDVMTLGNGVDISRDPCKVAFNEYNQILRGKDLLSGSHQVYDINLLVSR